MVLEVVPHVKLAKFATQRSLRPMMVHVVVEHVVEEVARKEAAGENEPSSAWQDSPEQEQEQARQWDARSRGHHKPERVVRVVVVDAVDHEMETVGPFAVSVKVEYEAVKPVLGKGPEEPATRIPEQSCSTDAR